MTRSSDSNGNGNGNDRIIVSASPKALMKVLILCGIALVIAISILAYNLILTTKYVEVEAKVVEVTKIIHKSNTKTYYITNKFLYNGKQYVVKQDQPNNPSEKEGDIVYIRCNPNNPNQIANTHLIKTLSIIIVIIFAFSTVIFVSYRKVRENK